MARKLLFLGIISFLSAYKIHAQKSELLVDLNANYGTEVDSNNYVSSWKNTVKESPAQLFKINDNGKRASKKGSGKPLLKKNISELNGNNSLVFRNDELINSEEDYFDSLTTGYGHTWFVVMKPYPTNTEMTEFGQKPLKDVNSFMGNLKNGAKFCGFWACLDDDLTVWVGSRNDLTFGRFDKNNPKITGPKLKPNKFYIIASRMQPGLGDVKVELFVDSEKPVAIGTFPVNKDANPSKLAIGTERDAIEHPGAESFDGEIARILIYRGALSDEKLASKMKELKKKYFPPK